MKDQDFKNYLDYLDNPDSKSLLRSKPPKKLIISIESLHLLNLDVYSSFKLIFDESESNLSVLISDTLYKSSELNDNYLDHNLPYKIAQRSIHNLELLFRRADKCLVLDGLLNRKTYDFCLQIFGLDNMLVVVNTYQNMKFDIINHDHIFFLGRFFI